MSQFPQVNVIEPSTSTGAAASGQIASNLNQAADRKLRLGEIRLNAMMEQHRIKTQSELEKMKIAQEGELGKQQIASTEAEHAKYQDFLAAESQKDRDAREAERSAMAARADKLAQEQQRIELARETAQLGVLHADIGVSKKAEEELAALDKEQRDLDMKLAATNVMLAATNTNNGIMLEELKKTATSQAEADIKLRKTSSDTMFAAVTDALGKAAIQQPGFVGRMERRQVPEDSVIRGSGEDLVSAFILATGEKIGERLGAVTPHIEDTAMTNAQTLVESSIVSLATNDYDGVLGASGLPTEGMKGMLLGLSNAVFRATENPTKENEAAAKAVIAEVKKHVPAAALDEYLHTFSRLRTDPEMKEKIAKQVNVKNSKEWKDANEEAFRGAARFYSTFKRLTDNSTDGSGAYINRRSFDYEQAFAVAGGSVTVMAADPKTAAQKLMQMYNAPPEVIAGLLEKAKALSKGTDTKERLDATIKELTAAGEALKVRHQASTRSRDVGLLESTAAGLQASINARTQLLRGRP